MRSTGPDLFCFVCHQRIVRHDDNWAELSIVTHRGYERLGLFSFKTCNDIECVKVACEALGLAVERATT